jgi:hypothetical protein
MDRKNKKKNSSKVELFRQKELQRIEVSLSIDLITRKDLLQLAGIN